MTKEEMDLRFKNRRRIALVSFALMSLVLVGLVIASVMSDQVSQRIATVQWLIGTATGMWSSLILGYFASASYEQARAQ